VNPSKISQTRQVKVPLRKKIEELCTKKLIGHQISISFILGRRVHKTGSQKSFSNTKTYWRSGEMEALHVSHCK
jgi:hypothetical protein